MASTQSAEREDLLGRSGDDVLGDRSSNDGSSPFIGLRPFSERDGNLFFGRDAEARILGDKVLSHNLTLLFAASGVGKSSLLQARLIPDLKNKERRHVIYCREWVATEFANLKKASIKTLGDVLPEGLATHELPLSAFVTICAGFTNKPIVFILDQFEEFFRYHRGRIDYAASIAELARTLTLSGVAASFVISMREDYALELDSIYKLDPRLFSNLYRMEKMTRSEGEKALLGPVEIYSGAFEEGLANRILDDISDREFSANPELAMQDDVNRPCIEPPLIQIVCEQLWELAKSQAGGMISWQSYKKVGGVQGLIKSFFEKKMAGFGFRHRIVLSKVFDTLVFPGGAKVATPASHLAKRAGVHEDRLVPLLQRLQDARVLRTHTVFRFEVLEDGSRVEKKAQWYELYHDLYGRTIERWNASFKHRLWLLYAVLGAFGMVVLAGFALSAWHLRHAHVRSELNGRLAVYQGDADIPDVFRQNTFSQEAPVRLDELAAIHRREPRPLASRTAALREIAGWLGDESQLAFLLRRGELDEALVVAGKLLPGTTPAELTPSVSAMAQARQPETAKALLDFAKPSNTKCAPDARLAVVEALGNAASRNGVAALKVTAGGSDSKVRIKATAGLSLVDPTDDSVVEAAGALIRDGDESVRETAVELLETAGTEASKQLLMQQLGDDAEQRLRGVAAEALGRLHYRPAFEKLVRLLDHEKHEIVEAGASALVGLAEGGTREDLERIEKEVVVRWRASHGLRRSLLAAVVVGIGRLDEYPEVLTEYWKRQSKEVSKPLRVALEASASREETQSLVSMESSADARLRFFATFGLNDRGRRDLTATFQAQWFDPTTQPVAFLALANLRDAQLEPRLAGFLDEHQDPLMISRAAYAAGNLKAESAVPRLLKILENEELDEDVHEAAADALGKIGHEAGIAPLVKQVSKAEERTRDACGRALYRLAKPELLPELFKAASATQSMYEARALLQALAGFDPVLVAREARAALSQRDRRARLVALRVLASTGAADGRTDTVRALVPMTRADDDEIAAGAMTALAVLGSQELLLRSEDEATRDRNALREQMLAAIGVLHVDEDAVELLYALGNGRVRDTAARAIQQLAMSEGMADLRPLALEGVLAASDGYAEFTTPVSLPGLLNLLQHNRTREYWQVSNVPILNALGRLGGSAADQTLSRILDDRTYGADLRGGALAALGRLGSTKGTPRLVHAMEQSNIEFAQIAIQALRRVKDPSSVAPLRKQLNRGDSVMRFYAALALGELKDGGASSELAALRGDDEGKVQFAATRALLGTGQGSALVNLEDLGRSALEPGAFDYPRSALVPAYFGAAWAGHAPLEKSVTAALSKLKTPALHLLQEILVSDVPNNPDFFAELLAHPRISLASKSETLRTLADRHPEAAPQLLMAVAKGEAVPVDLRADAIWELIKLKHASRPPSFGALLSDLLAVDLEKGMPGDLWWTALRAAARFGDPTKELFLPKVRAMFDSTLMRKEALRSESKGPSTSDLRTQSALVDRELKVLAYAWARLEPEKALELIANPYDAVREGAVRALWAVGDLDTVRILHEKRAHTDDAVLRGTAFQAIDLILRKYEMAETASDTRKLEQLAKVVDSDRAVKGRVAWTLGERQSSPAGAPAPPAASTRR